ncbi:helix-turn-helix transcriptional regulator [Moorella naiadis]|uniref:helix-turn-helix domain-containing protein n=1 Tax=Moorella naiadis (nom. illeg.) TaxID=3093670 RepID=UPI003D9C81AB
MNDFGTWLKTWREKKGLSMRNVAKILSLSQTYIWKLEGNKVTPSMHFLRRFATNFEAPEVYLAAGRLIPEEIQKKYQSTPWLIERLKDIWHDEESSIPPPPIPDDPELVKFILDIYWKLKKHGYTRRDLKFITDMVSTYLNAKHGEPPE